MNSDAEVIARRVRQVLLHPQVPFGRLNRRMSQRDLDLFEWRPALVRQFGESAAHVVGGERGAQPVTICVYHLVISGMGQNAASRVRQAVGKA